MNLLKISVELVPNLLYEFTRCDMAESLCPMCILGNVPYFLLSLSLFFIFPLIHVEFLLGTNDGVKVHDLARFT